MPAAHGGKDLDATLDDRTLRRIIALLVALAALAECAAGRSLPVRFLVLALLRRAEAVVRHHLLDATAWPGLDDDPAPCSSPADAALLSLRLRLLAAILGLLAKPARGVSAPKAGAHALPRSASCGRPALPCAPLPRAHDTS